MTRSERGTRPRASPLIVGVLAITAACTGGADGDGEAPSLTTAPPPTTVAPPEPRVDDGRLSLGLLLPADAPLVADSIRSTAQRVVAEINAAGGVLDRSVGLEIRDEGTTPSEAAQVVLGLVDDGVDAVIGPITSTHAITAIDAAVGADLVTCSPTATAAILDDLPDEMLFFRTIPSDSVQAIAIAESAENTGARNAAIIHVDDAFGRPFAASVAESLEVRAVDPVLTIGFTPGADLSMVADAVASVDADVLVVVAAGAELANVITAISAAGTVGVDTIFTNDAIRDPANQPVLAGLPDDVRERIVGVAPQIIDRRIEADVAPFGPQVTDCITLLALATIQAGSDSPQLIATQMPPVSSGGRLCRSFEACAAQIDLDRQIDYNGPTGLTELNRAGETSRAWFERFGIDVDGSDVFSDDGRLQIAL